MDRKKTEIDVQQMRENWKHNTNTELTMEKLSSMTDKLANLTDKVDGLIENVDDLIDNAEQMKVFTKLQKTFEKIDQKFYCDTDRKWALFFEYYNIEWAYKPGKFDTLGGGIYAPTFHLPGQGYFETVSPGEEIMQDLANKLNEPVFLALGVMEPSESRFFYKPTEDEGYLNAYIPENLDKDDLDYWGYNDIFLICDSCSKVKIRNIVYDTKKEVCCERARVLGVSKDIQLLSEMKFVDGKIVDVGLELPIKEISSLFDSIPGTAQNKENFTLIDIDDIEDN